MRYRAAFPSGFRPLVERLILRDYPQAGTIDPGAGDDSAVIFDAQDFLKKPPYAQGLSIVLAEAKAAAMQEAYRSITERLVQARDDVLRRAIVHPAYCRRDRASGKPGRFVVRSFDQGQPCQAPQEARRALERRIQETTGFIPDSQRPDAELQLQLRSDGRAYLLLVQQDRRQEDRSRGELPPATARLLCELSRPEKNDVFLDPFMGSGAIPFERARMGPYGMIFAGDRDGSLVGDFKEKLKQPEWKSRRKSIFPKTMDALDLGRFDPGLFTRIVTDPPWGVYGDLDRDALLALYAGFLGQARRILNDRGNLVLLTGRETPLEDAMERSGGGWEKQEEYPVLISGRKARVLRLTVETETTRSPGPS